jgi:flagellar FliJ protein
MYHFALEPLLTQRKFIEEALQKELAALQAQFNTREQALRDLVASRETCNAKLQRISSQGARIAELRLFSEYFKRLSIEAYEMQQALERLAENLDEKRREVVEAMKGRKILENLKERGQQAYREKMRKKEMKSADETAISLFNRNKN